MAEELELNSTQVEHEYGGSEIQVLEGLEAVRKYPFRQLYLVMA